MSIKVVSHHDAFGFQKVLARALWEDKQEIRIVNMTRCTSIAREIWRHVCG